MSKWSQAFEKYVHVNLELHVLFVYWIKKYCLKAQIDLVTSTIFSHNDTSILLLINILLTFFSILKKILPTV